MFFFASKERKFHLTPAGNETLLLCIKNYMMKYINIIIILLVVFSIFAYRANCSRIFSDFISLYCNCWCWRNNKMNNGCGEQKTVLQANYVVDILLILFKEWLMSPYDNYVSLPRKLMSSLHPNYHVYTQHIYLRKY